MGYPALNMDVGRAEALIGSLAYSRRMGWRLPALWETKIYHNALTHDMDDSHRPDVVISMDMPGRSHTSGAYTTVRATAGSHAVSLCADAYRSVLYADMTMYPPEGTPMFMLTWPDVLTRCGGLALNDVVSAGDGHSIRLSAKIDLMHRRIRSDEGLAALRIYFPGTARSRTGWQGRVAASYTREARRWSLTAGAGLGNRFPTVTEACGYFINNTFDRYDYIGNPDLDNEWAAELKMQLRWRARRLWVEAGGDAFFFGNYIIGRPDERLSAMTLGAAGVKLTRNAGNARIGNASVRIVCDLTEAVRWETRAAVAAGVDDDGRRQAPVRHRLRRDAHRQLCRVGPGRIVQHGPADRDHGARRCRERARRRLFDLQRLEPYPPERPQLICQSERRVLSEGRRRIPLRRYSNAT